MNPIERAVKPLRDDAIERAEVEAKAYIDRAMSELEEAGWDINKVAPYPFGESYGSVSYHMARYRYDNYNSLVSDDPAHGHQRASMRGTTPYYVVRDENRIERFIENRRTLAAAQYDSFVAKLVSKIGEVVSAKLEGNHVWGESTLTVQRKDKSEERWRTKQIVNVSKLGRYYNQWPTRKVK